MLSIFSHTLGVATRKSPPVNTIMKSCVDENKLAFVKKSAILLEKKKKNMMRIVSFDYGPKTKIHEF